MNAIDQLITGLHTPGVSVIVLALAVILGAVWALVDSVIDSAQSRVVTSDAQRRAELNAAAVNVVPFRRLS